MPFYSSETRFHRLASCSSLSEDMDLESVSILGWVCEWLILKYIRKRHYECLELATASLFEGLGYCPKNLHMESLFIIFLFNTSLDNN